MKTTTVLCMALCALVGQALAVRELKETSLEIPPESGITFIVCPAIVDACCYDFDFGKITDGPTGEWPENSECVVELSGSGSASYTALDAPVPFPDPGTTGGYTADNWLKKKTSPDGGSSDDGGSSGPGEGVEKSVGFTLTQEITLELVKYSAPNHIWRAPGTTAFCVCATRPPSSQEIVAVTPTTDATSQAVEEVQLADTQDLTNPDLVVGETVP